jgi:hypothetical protein
MSWFRRFFALMAIIIGAGLAFGGAYLLYLGGSSYYLLAGFATLLSGVLLWRDDRLGNMGGRIRRMGADAPHRRADCLWYWLSVLQARGTRALGWHK